MTETITLSDGTTVAVSDAPEDADAYATKLTVSGSQKVNLGNYENFEPHVSVSARLRPVVRCDPVGLRRVREEIDALRGVVDAHLRDATDRALADEGSSAQTHD